MARQRHWVNRGGPGDCIFATTTVLDFVHAFAREAPRDAMQAAIIAEFFASGRASHWLTVRHRLAALRLSSHSIQHRTNPSTKNPKIVG